MNWRDMLGIGPGTGDEEAASATVEDSTPAPEPPPGLEWWWLAEHLGHPAFYLRTLMPGDFAPGRLPAPRHVRLLVRGEGLPTEATCGTCGEIPRSEDLDVSERSTGSRGFLAAFRSGRAKWPSPTRDESCWMCSGLAAATEQARLRDTDIRVCAGCDHLNRRS